MSTWEDRIREAQRKLDLRLPTVIPQRYLVRLEKGSALQVPRKYIDMFERYNLAKGKRDE